MLEKVSADFANRDLAMQTANALQDLIEPAPDALTVFENGAAEADLVVRWPSRDESHGRSASSGEVMRAPSRATEQR